MTTTTTINTMEDLRQHLLTTKKQVTIIHLLASYTFQSYYMPTLLSIIDLSYNSNYEYININSAEIIQFYKKEGILKDIPWFLTFKKKYPNKNWWYPCKNLNAISSIDDISNYIKLSLR